MHLYLTYYFWGGIYEKNEKTLTVFCGLWGQMRFK